MKKNTICLSLICLVLYVVGGCQSGSDSGAATTADTTAPVTGTAISFSAFSATTLTVNWGAATDTLTASANLEYKVVKDNSDAANISSIALADAKTGQDLLVDWTASLTTKSVTGLAANTIYHVAVLVRDAAGNKSLYAPQSQTTANTPVEAISIANASFELPATSNNSFITSGPPTSWVGYGSINNTLRSVGVLNPNTTTLYLDAVPHGSNVGVAFLLDNNANHAQFSNLPAGIEQTLSDTLKTNSKYTLTVYVGNINQDLPPTPYQFIGFPNYRVELLAGGVVVASDNNTQIPSEGRFLLSTTVLTVGGSHVQAGQALSIRLLNLNSSTGIEVNFDNVSLAREF